MVHLESVAKGVRILVVLINVGLVRQPRDVSSQLLQIILGKTKTQNSGIVR